MKFFGLEIFDGKPLKEVNIDENIPLKEQWFHLTQDILCIDYSIHQILNFSIDVGWYPTSEVSPDAFFKTIIIEGEYSDGGQFFEKKSKSIQQLKEDLTSAISLIQSFKAMSVDEIMSYEKLG